MENKSTIAKWTVAFFAALILAFACSIALPQSAWAESESVTGTTSVGDTLTSSDGAVTYTIIEATSSTSTPGKVMLASVSDAREGDYAICDEVTCQSGLRTYLFDVVSVSQSAFRNASNITSLYIPATIEDTRSSYSSVNNAPSLYLYGCTSLKTVTVDEGSKLFSVQDNVLYNKDMSMLVASAPNNEALNADEGYIVPEQVRQVSDYAFYNCTNLKGIRFESDLTPESGYAIGEYAFSGSPNFEWIDFPSKVGGIDSYAFLDCTALKSVNFPDDALIYSTPTIANTYAGIKVGAFKNCTSLEFIALPASINGIRKGDYYYTATQYSPFLTFQNGGSSSTLVSGYAIGGWGHDEFVTIPVFDGQGTGGIFQGCTSLKSVTFRAGAPRGMFSLDIGNSYEGCTDLEALVFEAADQPYWMDPNRALDQASYTEYWDEEEDIPTYYYAVDYYLTDNIDDIVAEGYPENTPENVNSDDIYVVGDIVKNYYSAQDRLCRVEYARGTPASAIATSDEEVLSEYMYGDAAQYAQTGYSDGVIPDPNEAAAAAGLDTSINWVWKLSNTQSRRSGLSESCSAYLAPANDISVGRVSADQIDVEYKLCDQNLSRGFLPAEDGIGFVFTDDVGFDVARYKKYETESSGRYNFGQQALVNFEEGATAWFSLSSTASNFYHDIDIVAADGTVLGPDEYDITFEAYDADAEVMYDATLGQDLGPLLMTVTPTEDSGYTGVLKEWVLTEHHEGTVKSLFTGSSSGAGATWYQAQYYDGNTLSTSGRVRFGTYTERISSDADSATALLASSYAGLLKAKIEVYDGAGTSYEGGFRLSAGDNTNINFTPIEGESASERACAFYDGFEYYRTNLGATRDDYPWGNTAIITTPDSLDTTLSAVASYSYSMSAPIFFTEADNITLSKDTLTYLSDFDRVVVIGDETTYSAAAFSALKVYLGSDKEVVRITGDAGSTCALTLAVADELVATGYADFSFVSVIGGNDPFDILGALNFSGHEGGVSLVSTCSADTKRISAYLRDNRDDAYTIRLFGRSATSGTNPITTPFDLEDSLADLWGDTYEMPVVGTGDTLNLWGVNFTIAGDDSVGYTIEPTSGYTQESMPTIYAGTYYYAGTGYTLSQTINPVANTMSVYAGADRWQTANMIASSVAECAPFAGVIVCSGANGKFADALCAAGLSGLLDYPVVLVNGSTDTLDQSSADAIEALLVNNQADIVILGGTSTVSTGIETDLSAFGNVIRVAGDDRYATAEAVYDYGSANGTWSDDYAVVAIGNNFPDALGAASFCTTYAVPMLLTNQNSEEIESYVTDATARVSDIIIVGGTTSVPDAKANTLGTTTRMDGTDRYDTNLKFASWQIDHGMSLNGAGIATGTSFPDSLGSSYLLSLTKSVLLLSSPTDNSALYDLLGTNASGIHTVSVLGGENSVSADTRTAIQTAIGGDWETVSR